LTLKDLPSPARKRHIADVRCAPVILLLFFGCSSSKTVLPARPHLTVYGQVTRASRPASTLYRDEVLSAIKAGLGHFLQLVDLRPVVGADDSGRRQFIGFEIRSMRPASEWLLFDFAPGDVIRKIEGVSVEHYDSVIPVFEGLATKDQFEVVLLRGGEERRVVVVIQQRAYEQGESVAAPAK
jgi:S1-C subfamily serine protease